jgi:hypothetical protein
MLLPYLADKLAAKLYKAGITVTEIRRPVGISACEKMYSKLLQPGKYYATGLH